MYLDAKHHFFYSPFRNTYNYVKHTLNHTHHLPRGIYEQVAREDPYDLQTVTYDLDDKSLVLDIGGFTGDWAERIYCLYSCYIDIYEPHPFLFEQVYQNFKNNGKISLFKMALSNKNDTMFLYGNDMSASLFPNRIGNEHEVTVKKASDWFKDWYSHKTIDLMKVNIEGAEYDLMPDLIKNYDMGSIRNIKISFHNNVKDHMKKMFIIRRDLEKTHELVWCYPWWAESWRLRE